jgi:type III secretory pathway component EscU
MLHKLLGDGTLNTIQALLTLPIYRLDLPLNTALSNVIETNYNTFYEAMISFSDLSGIYVLIPSSDYLYLGLPSDLYTKVFNEI